MEDGMNITSTMIDRFVAEIASGNVDIYNEFSLQHELGIFLRNRSPKFCKVQFERNVSYFGLDEIVTLKREIDISVFVNPQRPIVALELKYPRNGQYPEQMFNFCKDIAFLESLVASGFQRAIFVAFADDKLFYQGQGGGIYDFFRLGRELHGPITKPTGKKNVKIEIRGKYKIRWKPVIENLRYAAVGVSAIG